MKEPSVDLHAALTEETTLLFDQCQQDAAFATKCAYDCRDGIMIGKISVFLQRVVLFEQLANEYAKLCDRDRERDFRRRGTVDGDAGVAHTLGMTRNGVYARLEMLGLHIEDLRKGIPLPILFVKSRLREDQEEIRRYVHTSIQKKTQCDYDQSPESDITESHEPWQGNPNITSLVDVHGAATTLGLSNVRVKQLAKQGRIGRKIAGRYLFLREELEQFAKLERPPGPKPLS